MFKLLAIFMRRVLYTIKKDYHYITHAMFVQLFYMYIVKLYIGIGTE